MAFAHSVVTTHTFSSGDRLAVPRKHGFLRHLLDAMTESRQREAEREIANYFDRCGGKFTDEAEREIERRFLAKF